MSENTKTVLTPEELDALERAPAALAEGCTCRDLDDVCASCCAKGMIIDQLPALIASARRLGEVTQALNASLAATEMAEHAHDACEEQLAAATARADAAERKVADLVDLVEDRLNYIDDRHVVKELRAALAAAKVGGGG